MAQEFIGVPSNYPTLVELRKSKTAEFKPNRYWNQAMKLRYYQVVGALHMILLERMVLGDGTGLGKCVSENTRVWTSKGLIRIGDLVPQPTKDDSFIPLRGIDILSLEGPQRAQAIYNSGYKKGLLVTTHHGYSISGLGHHPVLVPTDKGTDWRRLDQLTPGEYICINRKGLFPEKQVRVEFSGKGFEPNVKQYRNPELLNETLAELLGYYVSEGCSSVTTSFSIEQHNQEINTRIRFLLKNVFGYTEKDKKSSVKTIRVTSTWIRAYFAHLGVAMDGRSGGQVVPESIMASPEPVVRAFLRGYFEGDGSAEAQGTISCSSKSEELLKQIQILLLGFGIVSRRRRKMVKVGAERKPYWVLYFCGTSIDLFHKRIGFVSSRKTEALLKNTGLRRNTNLDIIPFGGQLIKDALRDVLAHLRTLPGQKGFSIKGSGWKGLVGERYKSVVEAYTRGKRGLSYVGLKKFIDTLETHGLSSHVGNIHVLKDVLDRNLFFDTIESINPEETRFVDFTVPGTHNFTGNGFINHNTAQTLAAYSFLLDRDPSLKLLVVSTKSATGQWAEEIEKFMVGVTARVISTEFQTVSKKLQGYEARKAQYGLFKENVMVINYAPLLEEYDSIKEAMGPNYMVTFDECVAFKGRKTKTHFACEFIAKGAKRCYGLSATIIKNGLEEVYGIYDVVVPGLFGRITHFRAKFCVEEMMRLVIAGKVRKIPKTVGYKNLAEFKTMIDPYFLIRRKEEVAEELPKLISRKVLLDMYPEQKLLYKQALSGVLYEEKVKQDFFEVSDKVRNGDESESVLKKYAELKEKYDQFSTTEGKKRGKLAALTYCQMASNGPALLNASGESSKDDEFIRLIKEELQGEKVIVFTRFKSGIPNLEVLCERNLIKFVKITGDCSSDERDVARIKFQTSSDHNIIFITTAGSASLNLQAASTLIFIDTPWSWGDLVQTIGRAQRIGSLQEHVLLIHFVNRGTIDVRVMDKVSSKKDLSDAVLGDIAQGALDFTTNEEHVIDSLYEELLKDAEV